MNYVIAWILFIVIYKIIDHFRTSKAREIERMAKDSLRIGAGIGKR